MGKPNVSIDPNTVIDHLTAELADKSRQYAELHVAFNSVVNENEKLRAELGRHVSAKEPRESGHNMDARETNKAVVTNSERKP